MQYKTELKYTKRGLYISLFALFISIASPFWMTCYNNRYAVTTIDSSQISKIVYAIKKLDNSVCANGQLKENQNVVNDTLVIQRTRHMRLEPIEHKDKVVDDTNNAK